MPADEGNDTETQFFQQCITASFINNKSGIERGALAKKTV